MDAKYFAGASSDVVELINYENSNSLQSRGDSDSESYQRNINNNFDDIYAINDDNFSSDTNEIILDGETQVRFLGNIRVWQLAASFLFGCIFLMFILIVILKLINKMQKEKYLMFFMMETKLNELEKKSFKLLMSGLNHSMERISSISSKLIFKDRLRHILKYNNKKSSISSNQNISGQKSVKGPNSVIKNDEIQLSVRELTSDSYFNLEDLDTYTYMSQCDSFA